MTTPWDKAADRTERHYIRKVKQAVFTTLEEIAPQNSDFLFNAIESSRREETSTLDTTLLEALIECYENASHWSTRRQILSIIADKVSFTVLQKWIPDISRYRYNIARHHTVLHGRGAVVQPQKKTRMRVSPEQLDHFLVFITSSRIVQDLPFGEKTLKCYLDENRSMFNLAETSLK